MGGKIKNEYINDQSYCKVKDCCPYTDTSKGTAHRCNLTYSIPKEIPVVFLNRLDYNCHFIINELAKEFEVQLNCLGEYTEKYKTFSFLITNEVKRIDKNRKENIKNLILQTLIAQGLWQLIIGSC